MDSKQTFSWPPPYSFKTHPRARRVKLKTSIKNGLEIVAPLRFNKKHIPEILESNKAWIEKQLNKLHEHNKSTASDASDVLPNNIYLPAIEQTWKIHYKKTESKNVRLLSNPLMELTVFGNIDDKSLCKKILGLWIKNKAKTILAEQLEYLSKETKLKFASVTIRDQKTRWGSCSSDKSINLNYKLLLLPTELVNHVLIHELCHTIHLNHSGKFWRLVASFDPYWKEHSKEIRKADKLLPRWIIG